MTTEHHENPSDAAQPVMLSEPIHITITDSVVDETLVAVEGRYSPLRAQIVGAGKDAETAIQDAIDNLTKVVDDLKRIKHKFVKFKCPRTGLTVYGEKP